LGGEGKLKGKFSAKVHLAPRPSRQMIQQSRNPASPPNFGRQDFRPPTPDSPRYERSKEGSFYYHCAPVEEEKKTSDSEGKDESIPIARQSADVDFNRKVKITIRPEPSEPMSSLDQEGTPGKFVPVKEEDLDHTMRESCNFEEGQAVDDIAMSPIPYDREDPVTLMDLPDDILTLPISPCGPHDDPCSDLSKQREAS